MKIFLVSTLLCVILKVEAYNVEQLRENLFVKSFFSTCNICKLFQEFAKAKPSLEEARDYVFKVCETLPKTIFEHCDHVGSRFVERTDAFLSSFAYSADSCDAVCAQNSDLISKQHFCEFARHVHSKMNSFVTQVIGDLKQLCVTAKNPFQCLEEKVQRQPFIEGLIKRSFVRVANMIDPIDSCNLDMRKVPGGEQLKAEIETEILRQAPSPTPQSPPSKVLCELCSTMFKFIQQILTPYTPTGEQIVQQAVAAISSVCQQFLHKEATECDELANQIMQLTVFLPQLQEVVCGQAMQCDKLSS